MKDIYTGSIYMNASQLDNMSQYPICYMFSSMHIYRDMYMRTSNVNKHVISFLYVRYN